MQIRKLIPEIMIVAGSMVPMSLGKSDIPVKLLTKSPATDVFIRNASNLEKASKLTKEWKIISDTNFVGGITKTYSEENIAALRKAIKRKTSVEDYIEPIKNDKNVYIDPFGMFFAKRPGGRPHLGLDIFVSPYAKKPEKPVVIQAPVDGIIISNKKANPDNNAVSNCVSMLGVDGNIYSFDHMARENDYNTFIKMPKLGSVAKKGDALGYVGHTGETDLWHLHLCIRTQDQLKTQKNSNIWKKIEQNNRYSKLSGQADPLSQKESGFISIKLNRYKKENMKRKNNLLLDYHRDYIK